LVLPVAGVPTEVTVAPGKASATAARTIRSIPLPGAIER
jgi:hypothetical protein